MAGERRMMFIDDALRAVACGALEEGKGLDDTLARAVRAQKHALFFSLRVKSGVLIDTSPAPPDPSAPAWKEHAYRALIPDTVNTSRFVLSVSSKVWEILSCFPVHGTAFCAAVIMHEAESSEQSLRAGMIKLMNSMCKACRPVLQEYIGQIMRPADGTSSAPGQFWEEKFILQRIAAFSRNLACVALIGDDGGILGAFGCAEDAQKIAGNLARFHGRCLRDLDGMGINDLRSASFSGDGMSSLIGRIEGSGPSLAIAARGLQARSTACFLFDLAQTALGSVAHKNKALWGLPAGTETGETRIRTSWFGPAQIASPGKFACKKGGKSFHLASCKSLLKAGDDSLDWFEKRADAIRSGLVPCKTCNP
jgi:hypothetical protein